MSDKLITKEMFQEMLPKNFRKNVSGLLLDQINKDLSDPEFGDTYRENLLSYTSVLNKGRFQMHQYLNAVKYVSLQNLGESKIDSYKKTFPEKYIDFKQRGVSDKDISVYSTKYGQSKMVLLLMQQTMMPAYVANHSRFQEALDVQVDLMNDEKVSPAVRQKAADSVMSHLTQPDNAIVELDIKIDQGSIIDDYEKMMHKLVAKQKELMAEGGDVLKIANFQPNKDVVDAEVVDA